MDALSFFRPFGIDIFCTGKKFLIYNMVGRNLKVKYRRSILGVFWTLLAPLALVGIYYFAFKIVLKIDTPHYLAYLVSGILPWAFFSQTILEGLESISSNAGLITKIPVPLQAFPLVGMVTNLTTLLLAIPVIIGVSIGSGVPLNFSVLALPYLFLLLALTCYGVSTILALLFIYFQDLKHITGILMQLWFYGTPVLYHAEMIPAKYMWVLYVNPVGTTFVAIHRVVSEGLWPTTTELGVSTGWAVAILFVAIWIFKSVHRNIAENI